VVTRTLVSEVLVVGRSDLVRRGLSSIAERGGLHVVAECRTPEAGIDAVSRDTVDVAVMDVDGADVRALLAASTPLASLRQQLADRRLEAELARVGEEWRIALDLGEIAPEDFQKSLHQRFIFGDLW